MNFNSKENINSMNVYSRSSKKQFKNFIINLMNLKHIVNIFKYITSVIYLAIDKIN